MTTVLYSAVYGDRYDTVKDVTGHGADRAVLFTDDPAAAAEATGLGWDEAVVDRLERIGTPMLRAKWWKCRPDLALPDADVTLWIDASMTPVAGYAELCLRALGEADAAFTPHPWRDCIYDELDASVGLPKYDDDAMRAQVARYRAEGHPPHWGLFASGAIARRRTWPVAALGRAWWSECERRSWQDQLSLPVLLRGTRRMRWVATLPWATWWGYTDHGVR